MPLHINPSRTAVLFLDFQNDVCEQGGRMLSQDTSTLASFRQARKNAATVLAALRENTEIMPPIHIAHQFERNYPEFKNARLSPMDTYVQQANAFTEANNGYKIVTELTPAANEWVLYKQSLSPFATTKLGWLLNKRDINTLALAGVVTHYAVLATAFSAYDAGYSLIILNDCCSSGGTGKHEFALSVLAPLAQCVDSVEFIQAIAPAKG